MQHLMDSVTAGLKKAKEERRRAETEIYSSQNPLAKSLLKDEICSQSSSTIPKFSGQNLSSKASLSHRNQNSGASEIKVP